MNKDFYSSPAYKKKQSLLTKENWRKGAFASLKKRIRKICQNSSCNISFYTTPSDQKVFCSKSCAVQINNHKRLLSIFTKQKISLSLKGRPNPQKGIIKIKRVKGFCQNSKCHKEITFERWRPRKFCSKVCAMKVIGSQPTSPRAARAKAGIRKDLGTFYFYSRWEANFARILNLLKIKWEFQPKTFDLKSQKYTPDFYLPDYNSYIEIKNFLSDYSFNRDQNFRSLYPNKKLILILKENYLKLQKDFSPYIENWEFS